MSDVRHNDVVIVLDEFGDAMCLRVKMKEGQIYLMSDNSIHPTIKINGDYRLIGKLIKICNLVEP